MSELHPEVIVLGGYTLFLLGAAATLDVLARHSHRRSQRYLTAGFRYHRHLDAWECPEGQHLWPHEYDRERRLARYRGKPRICNACPRKAACTDSDDGREIVRFLDDWPRLEAGRFHRGLALTLIVLAGLMAATALARHHALAELALLGSLLLLSGYVGLRLARGLGLPDAGLRSAHEAASRLHPALARPPSRTGAAEKRRRGAISQRHRRPLARARAFLSPRSSRAARARGAPR